MIQLRYYKDEPNIAEQCPKVYSNSSHKSFTGEDKTRGGQTKTRAISCYGTADLVLNPFGTGFQVLY